MSRAAFAVGDVVRLKSGGPTMTVASADRSNGTKCQWFAGKKMEWGYFPAESLVVSADDDDAKLKAK